MALHWVLNEQMEIRPAERRNGDFGFDKRLIFGEEDSTHVAWMEPRQGARNLSLIASRTAVR